MFKDYVTSLEQTARRLTSGNVAHHKAAIVRRCEQLNQFAGPDVCVDLLDILSHKVAANIANIAAAGYIEGEGSAQATCTAAKNIIGEIELIKKLIREDDINVLVNPIDEYKARNTFAPEKWKDEGKKVLKVEEPTESKKPGLDVKA